MVGSIDSWQSNWRDPESRFHAPRSCAARAIGLELEQLEYNLQQIFPTFPDIAGLMFWASLFIDGALKTLEILNREFQGRFSQLDVDGCAMQH